MLGAPSHNGQLDTPLQLHVKLQINLLLPLRPAHASKNKDTSTRFQAHFATRRALRHGVAVARGASFANAAQVGAQLIPVQVPRLCPRAVRNCGQRLDVMRRRDATARAAVQRVTLYVAERVTDGGPVHRLHRLGHVGTAQSIVALYTRLCKWDAAVFFCLGTGTVLRPDSR